VSASQGRKIHISVPCSKPDPSSTLNLLMGTSRSSGGSRRLYPVPAAIPQCWKIFCARTQKTPYKSRM